MQLGLTPLFEQLDRAPDLDYVLATVIGTAGSSYRKAGAMMLLVPDHEPLGMVSGGCLEGDLMEHARTVRANEKPLQLHYDLSEDDAALWGLGLGCGGAIDILLEPASRTSGFAGLARVQEHWRAGRFCWWERSVATQQPEPSKVHLDETDLDDAWASALPSPPRDCASRLQDRLLIPVSPPPHLVVCGAGADAVPVVILARQLDWRVTLVDHRAALATAARFGADTSIAICAPDQVEASLFDGSDAVVIMAHHLERDAMFLQAAIASDARYIGLLGPTARREDVMQRAGVESDDRLYGPAGLNIGANLPETIALSILAQAQAVINGRTGGTFE
jgi:xanthine/CO dehydrogenase XdhC/CoxF family maturation factor